VKIGTCLVVAAVAALACRAEEQEIKVKMRDLPEAVRKTVQEQSKGAALRGVSKEVENGQTLYEASLKVDGHRKDVLIDGSGAVVEVEEQVTLASIPAAARESLQKNAAGGKLVKVESITRSNAVVAYEAAVKKGGKTSEIKVRPDGGPAEK
jgi:uncharacterized membrane protein YkoI